MLKRTFRTRIGHSLSITMVHHRSIFYFSVCVWYKMEWTRECVWLMCMWGIGAKTQLWFQWGICMDEWTVDSLWLGVSVCLYVYFLYGMCLIICFLLLARKFSGFLYKYLYSSLSVCCFLFPELMGFIQRIRQRGL